MILVSDELSVRARKQAPAGVQGRGRQGGTGRKITTFDTEADEWAGHMKNQ
jgi:hypothetical protein